jgi:signal transduction histidine kinase
VYGVYGIKTCIRMLINFIADHRQELISLTRTKIARRMAPKPTELELSSGVPLFLDRLAGALRRSPDSKTVGLEPSAAEHGAALLGLGYTVAQVVYDYGEICQAITELTVSLASPITTDEFQTLNRCLDDAIAEAVTEFTRLRDQTTADGRLERSGAFAQDLRHRITAARLAFTMIKSGRAPSAGSVAAVVTGNLQGIATLINRSLVEVRLESGRTQRQRVSLREVMAEVEVDGSMEASHYGVLLHVPPVDAGLDVEVDGQILVGAISNILQNAFKCTRAGGSVVLKVSAAVGRVRIEVEDQCGGLAPGRAETLAGALVRRGTDQSGLGAGLLVSRRGVQSSGGELRVRDVQGKGCIFTIDLPQLAPAA